MYQLKSLEDTIVAISTANGQAGIGIIRLSGIQAVTIVDGIFLAKNKKKLSACKSFTVNYGWIMAYPLDKVIDEVLVTVMRAPKSYTKEDVVEISCHGGIVSLRAILQRVLDSGARLAEPGEFTKRAFLNGRIDLTQAEAVLDIIQSKTDTFLQVSTNQLKGELSIELESIREALTKVYIEMEAVVNFPEDDIDSKGRAKLSADIEKAKQKVEGLLKSSEQGRILKEGIKIVLCGKPNVGKSSLLNVLLKQPRAIVSAIAGTTRDTIEETAQIRGIPFQLIDTAGILEPRDVIEEEAIKRSHMSIKSADLVLLMLDASCPLEQEDRDLMSKIKGQNIIVVLNKCDLKQQIEESQIQKSCMSEKMVKVSALEKKGVDALEKIIVEEVWHGKTVEVHGILISNVRHITALKKCFESLDKARSSLSNGLSLEFVSEDIKVAVNYLDSITGRNIDTDLLDNIFSQFCIGK